jgi:hypothetical protein
VAADPTDSLALEAAARRRDTSRRRTSEPQRLAAIQRVTRAQRYSTGDTFSHFSLFALVTAGRSEPREGFDPIAIVEHLSVFVAAMSRLATSVEIVLSTTANAPGRDVTSHVRLRFEGHDNVMVTEDPERLASQRYYSRACFKVNVTVGDSTFEAGDGGFTDWTERLLDDRRERLLISAAGLDRFALTLADSR